MPTVDECLQWPRHSVHRDILCDDILSQTERMSSAEPRLRRYGELP